MHPRGVYYRNAQSSDIHLIRCSERIGSCEGGQDTLRLEAKSVKPAWQRWTAKLRRWDNTELREGKNCPKPGLDSSKADLIH